MSLRGTWQIVTASGAWQEAVFLSKICFTSKAIQTYEDLHDLEGF